MPFIKTEFPGLLVFEPKVFEDNRGYFFESYNQQIFFQMKELKLILSRITRPSLLLALYADYIIRLNPHAQTKLLRVLSGEIIDAVVDIRKNSPTYGKAYTILLSAENKKQLLVPKGFAHGYSVISETAEVFYKCDEFYHKESEGGISGTILHCKLTGSFRQIKLLVSEKDIQFHY